MTGSAIHISRCASAAALATILLAAPLAARVQENVRDRDPNVKDVAKTPLTDLNLAKDPIPALLLSAAAAPYASEGLDGCGELGGAIAELDALLGPDLDVADEDRDDISVGRIAKSAVGSFIPFRSIVREISGAADHQRQFEAAIVAGAIRRGYLKGVGQQMGCSYPARPAFAKVAVTVDHRVEWTESEREMAAESAETPADGAGDVTFVSREVVQETDD